MSVCVSVCVCVCVCERERERERETDRQHDSKVSENILFCYYLVAVDSAIL